MAHPILVTGAAGGTQGPTGRLVASLLLERGLPVRALVHKLDSRSDGLRKQGAEVIEGDLLNAASVQAALRNVKRAYFTYPVADGLLEAVTIFAAVARDAGLWLKTIKSQICSKTYESYESLLAKYIRPSLGKKPLVGIRPFDVQGVYQAMSERGLSPSVLFNVVEGTSTSPWSIRPADIPA